MRERTIRIIHTAAVERTRLEQAAGAPVAGVNGAGRVLYESEQTSLHDVVNLGNAGPSLAVLPPP